MELKTICDKLIEFFEIEDIGYLGDKLREILFSEQKNKIIDDYIDIVKNIDTDWIQKIYQYYKSNRDDFHQDYTPASLSKCVADIVYYDDAKTVYDICSGSGSLSIELHKKNNDLFFVLQELDNNVIPFLLFNLCIRNMNAVVIRGDVIKNEQYDFYKITSSEKYSDVEIIDNYKIGTYDIVISNPPFNIKKFENKKRFDFLDKQINKSSNSFFTAYMIEHMNDKATAAIILPTGFITAQNKSDITIREYVVNSNILDTCISMPGSFFESTATNTSVLFLNKNKKDNNFLLIDNTKNNISEWIREQRGQFGGNAHTKRVYKKKFNILSDENINKITDTIKNRKSEKQYSELLELDRFESTKYSFNAGQYFEIEIEHIDITQEEYDKMIDDFLTDINAFTDELMKTKETLLKILINN